MITGNMHKNLVKIDSVVFELRELTNKWTNKMTYLSQYFPLLQGAKLSISH